MRQKHINNLNAIRAKVEANAAHEFASRKLREYYLPIARLACNRLIAEVEALTDEQLAVYAEAGYEYWDRVVNSRMVTICLWLGYQ